MSNLIAEILKSEKITEPDYYIEILNWKKSKTVKSFLKEIGIAFKFPSYYGRNFNALLDCLNVLEWIDKPNYMSVIINSDEFLIKENAYVDFGTTRMSGGRWIKFQIAWCAGAKNGFFFRGKNENSSKVSSYAERREKNIGEGATSAEPPLC